MKTVIAGLISLFLVACGSSEQRVGRIQTVEQLSQTMTYFYKQPDRTTFEDVALDLEPLEPQLNRLGQGTKDLLSVFLWRCVERYGFTIPSQAGGGIVARARVLADTKPRSDPDWVAYIKTNDGVDPHKLDVNWTSYFATGDSKYLDVIFSATHGVSGTNVVNLVKSTAEWSFKANCKQHPAVLEYAETRKKTAKDEQDMRFLDECIQYARGK